MPVRVVVVVIMVAVIVIVPVIAATHMMVMRLLRGPDLLLIADDLGAVFAELAVHVRVAPSTSTMRSTKASMT
jgi:hypothetical protein